MKKKGRWWGFLAAFLGVVLLAGGHLGTEIPFGSRQALSLRSVEPEKPSAGGREPTAARVPALQTPPETPSPAEPQKEERPDPGRPYFGTGTCQRMDQPFHLLLLYLDDESSSWDPESISSFDGQMGEALRFLKEQAALYDVDLQISCSAYYTDEQQSLHYEGTVVSDLYSSDISLDLLPRAAADLGCTSEMSLYRREAARSGRSQMAIVVAVNRPGISYTIQDEAVNDRDAVEYSVIFNGYPGSDASAGAATVVHELLHQFGAEDYYDPYGTSPRRRELAEQYCSRDIMLRVYENISCNEIGAVTAYTVGWLREAPELVRNGDWRR